jgi:hypothetical protein
MKAKKKPAKVRYAPMSEQEFTLLLLRARANIQAARTDMLMRNSERQYLMLGQLAKRVDGLDIAGKAVWIQGDPIHAYKESVLHSAKTEAIASLLQPVKPWYRRLWHRLTWGW